jgi:SEC-C motif domain protein
MQPPKNPAEPYPCGSGQPFTVCCGLCLLEEIAAPTAEVLMRSRYCAYIRRDEAYLLRTWHPAARPDCLNIACDDGLRWIGLKILNRTAGGANDNSGTVEFVARYKVGGKAGRLHENSRFVREDGKWYYVDGEID